MLTRICSFQQRFIQYSLAAPASYSSARQEPFPAWWPHPPVVRLQLKLRQFVPDATPTAVLNKMTAFYQFRKCPFRVLRLPPVSLIASPIVMRPCSRANPTIGKKFSGMDGLDDLFALLFSLTKVFRTEVERGKSFTHISTAWFTKKKRPDACQKSLPARYFRDADCSLQLNEGMHIIQFCPARAGTVSNGASFRR